MPKRKLTDKVKRKIKEAKGKVKLKDYTGEALIYLKKYKALAKARKTKAGKVFMVGDTRVPVNSELYKTVEKAAQLKGQSVKTFVRQNKEAVQHLLNAGSVTMSRESEYLIKDINALAKDRKVYINDKKVSHPDAAFAVKNLQIVSANYTDIFMLTHEVTYSLSGDLYMYLPTPEEYSDRLTSYESGEMGEEDIQDDWEQFLDEYDSLTFIQSAKNPK